MIKILIFRLFFQFKMKKNKIFLFPLTLAVIFFASIIIIFSPIGHKNIVALPTPTPVSNNDSPKDTQTDESSQKSKTETVATATKQIGFIKKAYYQNNKNFIDIDYIEWIDDNTAPNGFRIKNSNPLIRSFEVLTSSPIYLIDFTNDGKISPKISFTDFIDVLKGTNPNYNFGPDSPPFWVTINASNQVIEIKEQYTP